MTFIEAAITVLKRRNNTPMSPKEIWDEITKQGLATSGGKTPWATLDTILRLHQKGSALSPAVLKRSNPKGTIHFEAVGSPMKFKLYSPPPVVATIQPAMVMPPTTNKVVLHQTTDQSIGWKTLSVVDDNGRILYEVADCPEYTYMFGDAAHDTVKIGFTRDEPEGRLKYLRTGNPAITMDHVFPASRYTEGALHAKFADVRKDGEWFFRAKSLKAFLALEKDKHAKVLEAYRYSIKMASLEKDMLSSIKA